MREGGGGGLLSPHLLISCLFAFLLPHRVADRTRNQRHRSDGTCRSSIRQRKPRRTWLVLLRAVHPTGPGDEHHTGITQGERMKERIPAKNIDPLWQMAQSHASFVLSLSWKVVTRTTILHMGERRIKIPYDFIRFEFRKAIRYVSNIVSLVSRY